jgi:hypothetical protein
MQLSPAKPRIETVRPVKGVYKFHVELGAAYLLSIPLPKGAGRSMRDVATAQSEIEQLL